MITYLRMSSAWHKGDGPAQVPRSLVGDGEVAAGARVSWTCLDTRSGPTWPWPPGKNASLVKERGSGLGHREQHLQRGQVGHMLAERHPVTSSDTSHACILPSRGQLLHGAGGLQGRSMTTSTGAL